MKKNKIISQADAFGQTVVIGDEVIYVETMYKDLKKGFVVGFTPKGFRVADNLTTKYSLQRATCYVAKLNHIKITKDEEEN